MEFLKSHEKAQLQQILTRSSQLQTADERSNFLIFCGLENSCGSVQLDKSLDKFVISLLAQLSKVYITVENSEKLGLVIFLEYISQIDLSLSPEDKKFIEHIITKWERWQVIKTRNQQPEHSLPVSAQVEPINYPDFTETELSFKRVIREPSALVGYRIEPYVLQEAIGAGGSGLVYRAWNSNLGQQVCIKIFYPFKSDFAGITTIIARGVRGLARLNHPNIVKIFGFGRFELEDQASFYIVMELVDGKTLNAWNRELPKSDESLSERLQIAFKLAIALRDAHNCKYIDEVGFEQTGVLHGDIKPANILIRPDNSPVLIDFMMVDVQRLLDPKIVSPHLFEQSFELTAALGTPGFMAPEQEREGIVTSRTDVYSLGVTFCYLFFPDYTNPRQGLREQEVNSELRTLQILLREMLDSYPDNRPRNMTVVAERIVEVATAREIELQRSSNTQLERNHFGVLAWEKSKADELANIRQKLLVAKSPFELQSTLYKVEEFLAMHPNNVEGRLLKDRIERAIAWEISGEQSPPQSPTPSIALRSNSITRIIFLLLLLVAVGVLLFVIF